MSFSIGIVGLPNVGKSTLFKALTRQKIDIADYPFTTINPNVGVVTVPDNALDKIAEVIKPQKITPTVVEFVDIAGLVKGAHRGEGLGNQFLAHIRNCDAILEIVRAFDNPKAEHVEGSIDPKRDVETIKIELLMKDLETVKHLLEKLKKAERTKKVLKEIEFLTKIENALSQEKLISEIDFNQEEETLMKELQFLAAKPFLYLLNTDEKKSYPDAGVKYLSMNLKIEEEASELSDKEKEELKIESKLDQLILNCYNILTLITFYTVAGGKETRAWTLKSGQTVPEAGGVVHTDFETKFIRAEVIPWQKLVQAQSWTKARESGWLKTVGRDYIVQNGDVIEFKI